MARTALGCVIATGLALVLAAVPGAALGFRPATGVGSATSGFKPCATLTGVLCRYVAVPLDHFGSTPTRIRLFVAKRPAETAASRGTILFLAGGPGQASAQLFDLRSTLWQTLFPGYTVAAYDNRGTGDSDAIACPGAKTASRCARAIGPGRIFYGTRDNTEDLEAVRRALGVDRIALFGLSYGTKQALAYALAYPEHVERLLLDSVVLADGPDPLGLASLDAIPSALKSICHGGGCTAVTKDAGSDLARLANRLDAHPLVAESPVYTTHWTPTMRRIRIDGPALLSLATASDLNAGIAVTLPAAVKMALAHRPGLLEHLAALVSQQDSSDVNEAVFYATTCNDGPFPWQPDTRIANRRAALAAAVAALPAAALGRFGSWAALASAEQCLAWPAPAGVDPVTTQPLPDVPALVLAGDRDVRTPPAEGAAAAALFPHGRLLVVPGIGHTVVGSSACVDDAVRNWIRGRTPPARCPRVPLTVRPIGVLPRSVTSSKSLGPVDGLVGHTLGATVATLREAEAAWLTSYPSGWVVGLEHGLLHGENFDVFRYSAYSDVPGLAVSGSITFTVSRLGTLVPGSETGQVQVGGRSAAGGFLQIRNRRITGLLGGRHVSARF